MPAPETAVAPQSAPAPSPVAAPSSGGAPGLDRKAGLRGHDYATQVQMLAPGGAAPAEDVHAAAAAGVAGVGGPLPHVSQIQRSFGGYDISNVQAHTDTAASEASAAMGATAYASGNHVALGDGGRDLHTVAHEAAHVVQQQAGVQLSGGVGQAGDAYEQHADRVADAVVAGRSAEPVLSEMTGGTAREGSGSGPVQQRAVQREEAPVPPAPEDDAPTTPTRPTTDADFKAVPDWGTFRERVVTDLGKSESEALRLWKTAVNGIQVAQDKWAALGGQWSAMTAWVDQEGRAPFEALGAQLLPTDFPQPGVRYNLWSGGDAAQHYAAARGTILETSTCGKVFNRLQVTSEDRWGINQSIWRGLSRAYALRIPIIEDGIDVYQRKQGDIFAQIEQPAVQEMAAAARVDAHFNFIALVTDGAFGKDSKRDGPNTNEAWRERLTAAAGGDAAKAQAKAPRIFVDVTASDLKEAGRFLDDPGGWAAAISAHEGALITSLMAAEDALKAELTPPGGGGGGASGGGGTP